MLSAELVRRLGELSDLGSASALATWDQQVGMPPAGAGARGEVLATLAGIEHERQTSEELGLLLEQAEPEDERERAIVRVARRDREKALRIPAELAEDMERAAAAAQEPWHRARQSDDFALFAPFLERNLQLRRDKAACFPEAASPYDALMDDFEPGLTSERAAEVFARLRDGLVPLVQAIAERPAAPTLPGPFGVGPQRQIALDIARAMGFDEAGWRLDDAVHPFAMDLGQGDHRVTSRFAEADLQGIFCVLHEMGHGMYEAQVDPSLDRTTLGTGTSLGIHESQSRLWENWVGRSEAFWSHWTPRLRSAYGRGPLDDLGDRDVLRAINAVAPSLIRVDADEVTYCLHVVLRFELEQALVEGTLAVADLPGAWRERMRALLGIDVPDDAHGVLQDIHWAWGEFGYFPTYAIGNVVAGQLWEAMGAAMPTLEEEVAAGELEGVRAWLGEHVHRHGRTLEPAELLLAATGSGLDPEPMLRFLAAKYGDLYDL